MTGEGRGGVKVWLSQTEAAIYVNTAKCNDWGVVAGVGLSQKQYIIKGMTCGMSLHLVPSKHTRCLLKCHNWNIQNFN